MHFSVTRQNQRLTSLILAAIVLLPFLYSGNDSPTRLQQAERRGSLTLLTRNGASSYFIGPEGAAGPEYDIVAAFAGYLGLKIEVRVAEGIGELDSLLNRGQGELIAANLTRTPAREQWLSFGPDYADVDTIVVYKRGQNRPRGLKDLPGMRLSVIAGSNHEHLLVTAKETMPDLRWTSVSEMGVEDLMLAVADGELDATLVDSNIFKINSPFYPRLKPGFMLAEQQQQAWAFSKGDDDSLVQKARSFFKVMQENGGLAALQDRYNVNGNRLDRVGMFHFMKQVRNRLPALMPVFQEVAGIHGLDWRLLAAIGYQESHWDAEATSQTGVRGIMMLTQKTATALGITDRLDPGQSIEGGARYLLRMRKRIPSRIPEPDRTWMTLAAYNMGWGHLEDTRKLTQQQGGNPDRWQDVNERLPLLSQEHWFRQTRFGYARGLGARQFVDNVRSYFDTLVWMETHAHPLLVSRL